MTAGKKISTNAIEEENKILKRKILRLHNYNQSRGKFSFIDVFNFIIQCWHLFIVMAVLILFLAWHNASIIRSIRHSSNMISPFNNTLFLDTGSSEDLSSRKWIQYHVEELEMVLIPIPKTATRSLGKWLEENVGISLELDNSELCYHRMYTPHAFNIVFLRNPLKHIYSQYLECKYDWWGKRVTGSTNFPKDDPDPIGMGKWVSYFLDVWRDPEQTFFQCYNPYNLQSRYMTCKSSDEEISAHGIFDAKMRFPPIEVAKRNLDNLQFVGIVDYFKESLCMISFLYTGVLGKYCACGKLKSWKVPHHSHEVPKHSISDISMETLKKMKALTEVDLELYKYGLRRFLETMEAFEAYVRTEVLCHFKRAEIKRFLGTKPYS